MIKVVFIHKGKLILDRQEHLFQRAGGFFGNFNHCKSGFTGKPFQKIRFYGFLYTRPVFVTFPQ